MEQTQTINNPTTEQLIFALTGVFETHIKQLVDARVNQIFEAHATVKHLDEQWEERIKGYVAEAIEEHEGDYSHIDRDDIEGIVANETAAQLDNHDFERQIKTAVQDILSDGDYTTEDRVTEMIDEANIEDHVRNALKNLL